MRIVAYLYKPQDRVGNFSQMREFLQSCIGDPLSLSARQVRLEEVPWHGRLIMVKNTAYAWRQMIFYISFLSEAELQSFVTWAQGEFSQQREDFQTRFRPAMNGLLFAADGGSLNAIGADDPRVKRFLGWMDSRHWLLADA